ncbi:MAG: hypothetical protein K6U87_10995 [Firmicutes bacterium]|nr:hypothetical protein [Bacillota bacterium]
MVKLRTFRIGRFVALRLPLSRRSRKWGPPGLLGGMMAAFWYGSWMVVHLLTTSWVERLAFMELASVGVAIGGGLGLLWAWPKTTSRTRSRRQRRSERVTSGSRRTDWTVIP